MPLHKGHQFSRVLAQNAWKVAGAFSIGVVAVIGGGLFLSDVHRIPQTARSTRVGRRTDTSSSNVNGASGDAAFLLAPESTDTATSTDGSTGGEKARRSRRKKNLSSGATAIVPSEDRASRVPIPPGPDIPAQLASRESSQLVSVLMATAPTLPANSPISVRLAQQVSAKENHKGEVFKATLAAPLIANGIVLAKAGAPVFGRIVDARSARLFRGGSNLNLELTEVLTDDGRRLRLRTTQWFETGSHSKFGKAAFVSGEVAKKAVSGVVAGAKPDGGNSDPSERTVTANPADPSEKNEKKDSVVLPSGSEIEFRLLEPIAVTGKAESR